MAVPKIGVDLRQANGSAGSKKLRAIGMVPSVLYGFGEDTRTIKVSEKELDKIIAKFGSSSMVTMDLGGKTIQTYIQEIQRDPVSKRLIHADFLHLIEGKEVRIRIPIFVHNTESLMKDGILLGQDLTELEVSCLPKHIVQSIDIDVNDLEVGDAVTVGELKLPKEIEVLHEADETVLQLYYNRVSEEEEDTGEEAEITEPIFDTGADEAPSEEA